MNIGFVIFFAYFACFFCTMCIFVRIFLHIFAYCAYCFAYRAFFGIFLQFCCTFFHIKHIFCIFLHMFRLLCTNSSPAWDPPRSESHPGNSNPGRTAGVRHGHSRIVVRPWTAADPSRRPHTALQVSCPRPAGATRRRRLPPQAPARVGCTVTGQGRGRAGPPSGGPFRFDSGSKIQARPIRHWHGARQCLPLWHSPSLSQRPGQLGT